jgi:hypothetical protein
MLETDCAPRSVGENGVEAQTVDFDRDIATPS